VLLGHGNHISIGPTNNDLNFHFTLGENCRLDIGAHTNFLNLVTYQAHDARLEIGTHVGFNGLVRLQMHEPSTLRIGDGCLIADQVEITTSDMHSIVDAENGRRLNPARSITIGTRVWIGQRAIVLKGSRIGAGAVIGAAAVVTGEIPENSVAAGNPARVVRRNATWNFNLL
jgi:acetyltransferase-like isoleucine patch superfamily enzyme